MEMNPNEELPSVGHSTPPPSSASEPRIEDTEHEAEAPPEDMADMINKQREQQMAVFSEAQAALEARKDEPELRRAAQALLYGQQIASWAAYELGRLRDMSTPMVQLVIQQQQALAAEGVDLDKLLSGVQSLASETLPLWRDTAKAEAERRDKRMRLVHQQMRRKDVPLPFASMRAACGEDGMTLGSLLLVHGASDVLTPVLRYCATKCSKAGAAVVRFSLESSIAASAAPAHTVLPAAHWRNKAASFSSLCELLDGFFSQTKFRDNPGVLIVEDADVLYLASQLGHARPQRLAIALSALADYAARHGVAMLVGITHTANEPPLEFPDEMPNTLVACGERAEGVEPFVVVGNDTITVSQLQQELAEGHDE